MPRLAEKAKSDGLYYQSVYSEYMKTKKEYGAVPNLEAHLKIVIAALKKLEKM